MLMSETGRLVLSYLLELDYRETREKFMSECPAIAELRSLGPKELSRACRVNNRTLTDLLKEYISLETQIRKLAEEISTEDDEDLQFDRPLRILKIIRDLLKKRESVNQKKIVAETKETSTQTVEISKATSTPSINLQKPSTGKINNEDPQVVKVLTKRSGSGPPRSSDGDKAPFFHTNIRVVPKVRTGFVPILPRSPPKPPAPPPEGETAPENNSADTNVQKSKPPLNNSRGEKKQSSDEVLDKIELVDLGKKIATAIPVNLDVSNISAIADKYLDDDDLFNNLLEAYSSFNPATEIESDQEMNTPVTSPMPDDLSHEEISEQNLAEPSLEAEGEMTDSNENKEPKSTEETKKDTDKIDTLAQIVQSTISVVTENYGEGPLESVKESLDLNQQPKVKEPRVRKRSSKNLKKRKDDSAQLNSFQRQLRGIIDINNSVSHTSSEKDQQVLKPKPQATEENLIMSKFAFLCNEKINLSPKDKVEPISKSNEEEKQASVDIDSKSQNSKPTKMKLKPPKRQRCKKCKACLAEPCGNCPPCRDKVCNGGRGILKKGCIEQRCLTLVAKNETDDKSDENIIDNNQATRQGRSSKKISSKKRSSQSPHRPILASPAKDVNKTSLGFSGGRPVHVRNLGFTSNSKPGDSLKEKEPMNVTKQTISEPRNVPTVLKRVPVTSSSSGFEMKKLTPLPHNPFLVRKDMAMIHEPTTINLAYNPQIPPAPLQQPNTAVPVSESLSKPLQVIQQSTNGASALKTIQTPPKKSLKSKTQTWDESLRAILGSAEKDTSHKKSPKKRSKRKSPKKLQSESEDDEELEVGSELNLQDTDITPEAQQILDTFANQLLEKIEEKVAENVVHIQPKPAFENKKLFGPTNPTFKGKHVKEKDCICCKVESMVRSRKTASPPVAPPIEEKTETETECKSQVVTPEKSHGGNNQTSPTFPSSSKSPDFVFKTPIKTVAGMLTTPSKAAPRLEGVTSLEDRALLLSPATPTRPHIPASPVAGLFSPLSRTPLSARRSRHQSSLHTPTHDLTQDKDAAFNSPVTPNSKQSPAPYYTPSPQSDYSVPSPSFTPGLKFLQEEGERLSQSDDSCSSASPSPGKNRITGAQKRKTFRNLFKKTTTEAAGKELGSMLEQKILSYPFSQRDDNNTVAPVKKTPSPLISPVRASYDYTSSPQITMGLSPGAEEQAAENSMSRQSSFVSPNRTCYLSPTVVAMSTSVLGISQILPPVLASDSEKNNGADIDTEDEDLHLELEASDEENNVNPSPAEKILSESLMAEQSSEDSKGKDLSTSDAKKDSPSSSVPNNRKSPGSIVEEEAGGKQKQPRRCALISTKRKSPLKNDATKFEQQFDANNLDKNRSSNASLFLDENINSLESDDEKQTVTSSQIETRRSPRKHKRKASISPKYNSKRKKIVLSSNDSEKIINDKKETDIGEKDGVKSNAKQTLTSKPKEKEKGKTEVKPTKTQNDKSKTESTVPIKKQEENTNKKSTISKSDFFVFQCMMPFGEFDE